MCGRFVSFTVGEELAVEVAEVPGLRPVEVRAEAPPRFNVGPTQPVQIIVPTEKLQEQLPDAPVSDSRTSLIGARWGLIPHWAKEVPKAPWFNARGETVNSKPAFRDAYKRSRCLVPADGWYEWNINAEGKKVPYYASFSDRPVFFAGLWTAWEDMYSCTIVTTASEGSPIEWLHDRMPRILAPEDCASWLWGDPEEVSALREPVDNSMLEPLEVREVDPAVGNIRNDGPELLNGPV